MRAAPRPLCEGGVWTEVNPAAIANGSALPGVACGRPEGACVQQEYLGHRCAARRSDADWPPLPRSSAHADVEQSVVADFLQQLRGKVLIFVGDSVTLNLWNFLLCEVARAGFNSTKVSGDSRDASLQRTGQLSDPALRGRVQAFWDTWFAADWGAGGPPGLGLDVDVQAVSDTGTILVRKLAWHFVEAEMGPLTALGDVLVLNFGLHYDLVNEEQRQLYSGHMSALFRRLAPFAATNGKAAFFRETSRTHRVELGNFGDPEKARAAGLPCACTPSAAEPPRPTGALEWSAELNALAARALVDSQAGAVQTIPFYSLTDAMSHGHPLNFTAYLNHLAHPLECDCTHWCYSPHLIRSVLHGIVEALPRTLLAPALVAD